MCLNCGERWGWGFLILFIPPLTLAAEENFQSDVQRLEFLQTRDKASLIALDKLGEELLRRYRKPQQQGEIYYYLAHQHAQGGFVFPQKAIEYSRKALEYPLTPNQKMRLYVYQGDVLQISDRKKPFTVRRRESVDFYLQGLKDLKRFQLSDTPPDVPNTAPKLKILRSTEQETQQAHREFQEAQRKYVEARANAEFTRAMMMHRRVLQGQVVSLYGRRPIATEELKATATNILGEGKDLDRLMTAVNDKVAKLPPEPENSVPVPVEAIVPTTPSKYLYLSIAIAGGAIIALVLLVLSQRSRAKREAGSKVSQKN